MSKTTDWLPGTRQEQLTMAKEWITVLTEDTKDAQGTTVKKYVAWGIPVAVFSNLGTLFGAAQAALTAADNDDTRTPVVNRQCKTAFDALTAAMRDMKRRYFFMPPLSEADIVSLGLKVHDGTPTPSGPPTAQVGVETFLVGRHELGIKIVYVTGSPDDPANKGYRIWYSVIAPGETPPANPDDLRKSFFTKRKTDVIGFDFGDSGKTVYFAVQVENDGKKGPWGPIVSALIP
jgi:hypothetical protein